MRAIGIVLAGGNAPRMRELTNKRAVAAMPLAGSYRAVDFALSSLANSKVQKVAVLTQYNSKSHHFEELICSFKDLELYWVSTATFCTLELARLESAKSTAL